MPDIAPAAPAAAPEPPAVAEAFPAAPAGDAAIQMDVDAPPGTDAEPAVVPAPAPVPVQQPAAAAVVPMEVTEDEVKGSWLAGQDAVYQVLRHLGWVLRFRMSIVRRGCACSFHVVLWSTAQIRKPKLEQSNLLPRVLF